MNIKGRLEKLEAAVPTLQPQRFIFFTRAGHINDEITGFKYDGMEILRIAGEVFDDFKVRAEFFLAENNPTQMNFFIQSIYKAES